MHSPPVSEIPIERSYRWGKFQAWGALAFAVAQFVLVRGLLLPLLLGVFFFFVWRGLLKKQRYGFVLLYICTGVAIGVGLLHLTVDPTWEVFGQILVAVCFWGIPAAFYYPKRYREFGFGVKRLSSEPKPQQEAEPQANAAALGSGSGVAEKPEGVRLVDYEEWREAVAVARVTKLVEEREKK